MQDPTPASARPINDPGVWDVFLSHGQATGGDQTKTLSLLIEKAEHRKPDGQPYTVWYDNNMPDCSEAAMEEGVQQCKIFLIFLTGERQDARQDGSAKPALARSRSVDDIKRKPHGDKCKTKSAPSSTMELLLSEPEPEHGPPGVGSGAAGLRSSIAFAEGPPIECFVSTLLQSEPSPQEDFKVRVRTGLSGEACTWKIFERNGRLYIFNTERGVRAVFDRSDCKGRVPLDFPFDSFEA
eukprot:COSAG01_NODE_9559_length_2409_cov_63.678788_1_plen_238_part_10